MVVARVLRRPGADDLFVKWRDERAGHFVVLDKPKAKLRIYFGVQEAICGGNFLRILEVFFERYSCR